jgi:glycosyltransferase involved in cell wall biosynthesis
MFDVVIPIYRIRGELLEKCLESVSRQTFSGTTQVWIIDGTPASASEADDINDIKEFFPEFNWIRQTGTGVSQARNQAVALGTQPWVAFLDGDDWWYPEHLEELATSIANLDSDHVMVWNAGDVDVSMTSSKGNVYQSRRAFNWFPNLSDWHPRYHGLYFKYHAMVFPSSVAVKRQRFEQTQGFPEQLFAGEDQILWYRLCGDPRSDDPVYRVWGNDYVGAYRLQEDDYFNKGQNPLQDLWGSEAQQRFADNLTQMEAYFPGFNTDPCPEDLTSEEWEILTANSLVVDHWDA